MAVALPGWQRIDAAEKAAWAAAGNPRVKIIDREGMLRICRGGVKAHFVDDWIHY